MKTLVRILVKILLPIVVLSGTAWTVHRLYQTRPVVSKVKPEVTVPLVRVAEVRPKDERVVIQAFGTVVPAREVALRSQVSGRLVAQHRALMPGGVIFAGDEVVRIDPTDYVLRVEQEQVAIELADAEFELERGQQVVAAKEWAMLKDEIDASEEMADFALRKPQRRLAAARVSAAKNRLALAKLDEDRTVLRVPFNSLVVEEFVDEGQIVTPQTLVANLVGTDRFWVKVSIPLDQISRIQFADDAGQGGSPAAVYLSVGDSPPTAREAHVLRLLGDLSESGRMARVLVAIEDPFGLDAPDDVEVEPILLNSYVRVEMEAGTLQDVCAIPRVALRENDRIWVRDGAGRLQIRDVDIVWRRPDSVLVANALAPDERLIVSRLAVVLPGMAVRVSGPPESLHASEIAKASSATQPSSPANQPGAAQNGG